MVSHARERDTSWDLLWARTDLHVNWNHTCMQRHTTTVHVYFAWWTGQTCFRRISCFTLVCIAVWHLFFHLVKNALQQIAQLCTFFDFSGDAVDEEDFDRGQDFLQPAWFVSARLPQAKHKFRVAVSCTSLSWDLGINTDLAVMENITVWVHIPSDKFIFTFIFISDERMKSQIFDINPHSFSLPVSTVTSPLLTTSTLSLKTISRKNWRSNAHCLTTMTPGSTYAFISSPQQDTHSSPWTWSLWKNWTARYTLLRHIRIVEASFPLAHGVYSPLLLSVSEYPCRWNLTSLSPCLVCFSLSCWDPWFVFFFSFLFFWWSSDSQCLKRIKWKECCSVGACFHFSV